MHGTRVCASSQKLTLNGVATASRCTIALELKHSPPDALEPASRATVRGQGNAMTPVLTLLCAARLHANHPWGFRVRFNMRVRRD